ncbi:MAG: hypothetical protein HND48_15210 [Chloroflexi bacterium]|nr:hypothetical protein [Chloroflexota bacterium]
MNLITRELWHGVNNALPRHPFLWYPLRYTEPDANYAFWVEFVPTVMLIVASFAALVLWVAYGVAPLSLVLILDTYAGVVIARGVGRAVQNARRHGLLDLMGVTISGFVGALWAVMTRYVRSDPLLSGLHQAAAWLHAMWLFAVFAFGALVLLTACGGQTFRESDIGQFLYQPTMLLNGFAVFAIMMLDYIGALVAGSIIGMMMPTLGSRGGRPRAHGPCRVDFGAGGPLRFGACSPCRVHLDAVGCRAAVGLVEHGHVRDRLHCCARTFAQGGCA